MKPENEIAPAWSLMSTTGLDGTFENSQVAVNIDVPAAGVYFIEARATFALPAP